MTEVHANSVALPNWGRVRQVLIGLVLTFWGYLAVQLSHQPNAAEQLWFEDKGLRTSSIYSAMHAPLWLGMGLCLLALVYTMRQEQTPCWLAWSLRWQSLAYRTRALILGLPALCLLIFRLVQPVILEDGANQIYVGDKYGQISLSVQSIEQGCFLCIHSGGQTVALEVLSAGDDLGAHLLYAALIRLSGTTPSIEHYISSVRALVLITLVFISLCLISMTGRLWAGISFFGVIAIFDGLFTYTAFLFTYHWSSTLTSWITVLFLIDWAFVPSEKQFLSQRAFVLIFLAYGAVAFILFSVRSSNGAVHWLFVVALLLLSAFQRRQWLRPALALTSFGVAYFAMSSLFHFALAWRNDTYSLETHGITSHPFSHALYIGLGVVTNEYGIYWNDGVVAVPCPMYSTSGYTHEYYDCIRQAFVNLVIRDPGLVLRSLLMKLEALLQNSLRFNPLFVALPLALFLIKSLRFWLFFGFLLVLMSLPALLVMSFHLYMTGYLSLFTLLFAICILKLPDYIYAQG
jgi:hypothetical protein